MSNEKTNNWEDAPGWAMFRAVDKSGLMYWFEHEPILDPLAWDCNIVNSRVMLAGEGFDTTKWRESLERRPEPQTQDKEPVTGEYLKELGFKKYTGSYVMDFQNGRRLIIWDSLDYMEIERIGTDWSLVIVNLKPLTCHKVKTAIEILK